jgi:division protein CdvB (Snf7/Vps24/ESCRT-III family)
MNMRFSLTIDLGDNTIRLVDRVIAAAGQYKRLEAVTLRLKDATDKLQAAVATNPDPDQHD